MSYLDHFSPERSARIHVGVLQLLQVQKLYRDPEITAKKIAEMLGEDFRAISAALAIETGDNFLTLLSRLRIREACRLLKDPKYDTWTAEEIGLRAGFASRQAFYLAFNRIMKMTPRQYRLQK